MDLQSIRMAEDFINVLVQLMKNKDFEVSVKSLFEGGLATGLTAVVGGLLLGPVGLAIGGVLGGVGAAVASKNKFKSAALVIKGMSREEKNKLLKAFTEALNKNKYVLVGSISTFIMRNSHIQSIALEVAHDFLEKNYKIKSKQISK